MNKILAMAILCASLLSHTYAQEVEFVVDSETYVKQATLETYKQALLQKSREERIRKMKEDILKHLQKEKEEVHDFSYRYKKKSIQKRALSCEISVASDILARHTWKQITEDFLIDKIDKSWYNQLPKEVDGKRIWGNPNLWFVGNIDTLKDGVTKASQWKMTWYGVLERPIAWLYEQFWLQTKIITEKSHRIGYSKKDHLIDLLDHLEEWHSVQLWWDYCTTPAFEDTDNKNHCVSLNYDRSLHWYYKDINGNLVAHKGLVGEHAFFLLGYTGNKNNPEKIIVWDSNTGKHSYKTEEWMRKWSMMQYRSLIVFKDEQ